MLLLGENLTSKKWLWIGGGLLAALIIVAFIVSLFPSIFGLYQLFWGRDRFFSLFYEGLGQSANLATLCALIATWIYVFAYAGFFAFTTRSIFQRNFRGHILGFVSFILFFGLAPVVHLIYQPLGQTVCFNQKDGTALKWYVLRNGKVLLFDSGGFDPLDGSPKLRVTADICRTFELQRAEIFPRKVSSERAAEIFPHVWFSALSGQLEFFDNPGVYPGSSELLIRVPEDLIRQLRLSAERDRQEREDRARRDLEEKNRKAEADRQAEELRIAKERAEREAARQLEELRIAKEKAQKEAEAAKHKLEYEKEQRRLAEIERIERIRLETERRERERRDQIRQQAERREQLQRERAAAVRAEEDRQERVRIEAKQECERRKNNAKNQCSNMGCYFDAENAFNC